MRTALRIALVCLLTSSVWAATPDGGTESPFTFGAGARELALGGANLTEPDAAFAPFWNPSRLSWAERFSVAAYHSQLFDADATYQYFGVVAPTMDIGTFGLGIFRLGVSDIEVRDVNNLLLGSTADTRLALYLAYGRRLGGFDVGLAANIEHHSLANFKATSSPGLSVSVSRRWNPSQGAVQQISAMIQGQNLLQPSERLENASVSLPYGMNAGASMLLAPDADAPHSLLLAASVHKSDETDLDPRFGVEYAFQQILRLRTGIRDGHANFGGGLAVRGFAFDYALVQRDLGSIHTFTLTTSFGVPISEKRTRKAAKRESEFRDLMRERMTERNAAMVAGLMVDGESAVQAGAFGAAEEFFDRALFLARSESLDTTVISQRLATVREEMERDVRAARYASNLDSARSTMNQGDYVGSRYYAGLALEVEPASSEAKSILSTAIRELDRTTEREKMMRRRLVVADSLLAYGRLDESYQVVQALLDIAPTDERVLSALQKVRFEKWRAAASDAFSAGDLTSTTTALDSALAIFPQHSWCLDLRAQAQRRLAARSAPAPVETSVPTKTLTSDLRKEVTRIYAEGQDAFEAGDLTTALDRWEYVERLAPGYQSVRTYLVRAYKFQGVELYGKNQLEAAIVAWERAAQLDPDHPEIASYIKRTQAEMRKLRELSYEPR